MSDPIFAGVIGWPVTQSRSPALHGIWLLRHGIAGIYLPIEVRPEHLGQALRVLEPRGFAGVNLTVPHKEAAVRLVDRLDPGARRIGSVNMVTVLPDGSLEGRSTDGYGFIRSLEAAAPGWRRKDGPVLLLGAGGAARAIADALIEAGVERIRIANRTAARSEAIARSLGPAIEGWPWERRGAALASAILAVNTTTLGMEGQPPLDLDLGRLPPDAAVMDIVYTPLETPLLAAARARGNLAIDGLGMLLHQAQPAFARWFGVEPAVDAALRQAVLASLSR